MPGLLLEHSGNLTQVARKLGISRPTLYKRLHQLGVSPECYIERYLTDWTGPKGRLARMTFRMKGSVFPGDTMQIDGIVQRVETDETGCTWADVDMTLSVDGNVCTTCAARIAIPTTDDDNPWARHGDAWRP